MVVLRRIGYFALATLTAGVAIVLVARTSFGRPGWIGRDNLDLLIASILPVSLLTGLAAAILGLRFFSGARRYLVPVALGSGLALFWVWLYERISPYGWGALQFELQGLALALAGSISGLFSVSILREGPRYQRWLSVAAIFAVCSLMVVSPRPFFDWYAKNQELTVVTAYRLPPGTQPAPREQQLQSRPCCVGFKDLQDVEEALGMAEQELRQTGISDAFEFLHVSREGSGKQSRMLLVLQQPIQGQAHLPIPDAAAVVYVQSGNEWRPYPEKVPVLKRSVGAEAPGEGQNHYGYLFVPDAGGITVIFRLQREDQRQTTND